MDIFASDGVVVMISRMFRDGILQSGTELQAWALVKSEV